MFSMFTILVIYLIIPSRCDNIPSVSGEKTTLNFEDQVKKELRPLKNRFNKIMDSLRSVDLKVKLGKIQGIVETKIKEAMKQAVKAEQQAVKAEQENKILLEDRGSLKEKMNDADKYKLLLGLTYRIDTLESTLAPGVDFKGKQRRQRWLTILGLTTPAVEKFRKKIADAGMTTLAFAECIERLCNERNSRAGHAKISLPRILNEKTIEEALAIMEIIDDKTTVETVKIIVAPIEDLDLITQKP